MRSKWIALIVAAGMIGGLAWSTSKPTEAAMVVGERYPDIAAEIYVVAKHK